MVVKFSTFNENYINIDQYDQKDRGFLYGYVTDTDSERLSNFLFDYIEDIKIVSNIRKKYNRIGIIKNFHVDDNYRGKGLGNKLLSKAIEEAYNNDAESIILIADMDESNKFDIQEWYEKYGFKKITNTRAGPLMILDEE